MFEPIAALFVYTGKSEVWCSNKALIGMRSFGGIQTELARGYFLLWVVKSTIAQIFREKVQIHY